MGKDVPFMEITGPTFFQRLANVFRSRGDKTMGFFDNFFKKKSSGEVAKTD